MSSKEEGMEKSIEQMKEMFEDWFKRPVTEDEKALVGLVDEDYADLALGFMGGYDAAIFRLAAPQPHAETQNLIKHLQANLEAANKTSQEYEAWGKNLYIVIDDLRAAIDEWGCKHDHPEIMHEIDAANTSAAPAPGTKGEA